MTHATQKPADILIVDDLSANLDALEVVLKDPSYNIVRADSATDALRHVMEREFALILMDVMMPGIDGFECARLIKMRKQSRNTPIIFLTAVAFEPSYVFRGYEAGGVDYMMKPLDPIVVQAKVGFFVKLYQTINDLRHHVERMNAAAKALEEEARLAKRDNAGCAHELQDFIHRCQSRVESLLGGSRHPLAMDLLQIDALAQVVSQANGKEA